MSTQNNTTSTIITNNIFASYNSEKVVKALEVADGIERKSAYETMGVNLENYQTMESALKISGLDFEVMKKPVYFNINADMKTEDGKTMPPKFIKVPDRMMTVREDTQQAFGLVSKEYEILQNREAFDFLDSMASEGGKFETAGLFKRNGAASYVTMSTEPFKILDDEFDIAVRTGYHCAPTVHKIIDDTAYGGTVRVSVGYFNTEDDIDKLIEAIRSL